MVRGQVSWHLRLCCHLSGWGWGLYKVTMVVETPGTGTRAAAAPLLLHGFPCMHLPCIPHQHMGSSAVCSFLIPQATLNHPSPSQTAALAAAALALVLVFRCKIRPLLPILNGVKYTSSPSPRPHILSKRISFRSRFCAWSKTWEGKDVYHLKGLQEVVSARVKQIASF